MADFESKQAADDEEIIYVKERPLLKLLVGGTAAIVGITVFLFVLGILMSFVGVRTPTFDRQIIEDQWDKTVNDPAVSYSDCVKKGGVIMESFPPQCSYLDDSFTQPLEEACEGRDPEGVTREDPCFEILRPYAATAYEVGEQAGELYEDSKEAGSAFIEGFKDSLESSE